MNATSVCRANGLILAKVSMEIVVLYGLMVFYPMEIVVLYGLMVFYPMEIVFNWDFFLFLLSG